MKKLIFLLAITCLTVACQSNKEKGLPIFGRKKIVPVEKDGVLQMDTIYHTIADFSFLNQDSVVVTNETFEGKIYVADFFFTSCPTICPVMKTQMLRVYDAYRDNDQVAILSHSIDPEHDTVAVLHDFADRLGVTSDKWHFVTGDMDDIYDLGQTSYMTTAMEDEQEPGGFLHSGAFILVDKERHIRGIYDGTKPEQVDRLINDIQVLLKEYKLKENSDH